STDARMVSPARLSPPSWDRERQPPAMVDSQELGDPSRVGRAVATVRDRTPAGPIRARGPVRGRFPALPDSDHRPPTEPAAWADDPVGWAARPPAAGRAAPERG